METSLFGTKKIVVLAISYLRIECGCTYMDKEMRMRTLVVRRHLLGGFLLGFMATTFDTYEFGPSKKEIANGAPPIPTGFFLRDPSVFPVLFPLSIPFGANLLTARIKKSDVSAIEYLNSEEYIEGFNKVRKFKRIKNSFIGGLLGSALGFICFYALSP